MFSAIFYSCNYKYLCISQFKCNYLFLEYVSGATMLINTALILFKQILDRGVDGKLIWASTCEKNIQQRVRTWNVISFETRQELRQSWNFSPTLFIVMIGKIMKNPKNKVKKKTYIGYLQLQQTAFQDCIICRRSS